MAVRLLGFLVGQDNITSDHIDIETSKDSRTSNEISADTTTTKNNAWLSRKLVDEYAETLLCPLLDPVTSRSCLLHFSYLAALRMMLGNPLVAEW